MQPLISISDLSKTYDDGFQALKGVDLEIRDGEILALLGPNGAGKTTLISIICGISKASEGSVTIAGYDVVADYRATRSMIGLVPQELATDVFESVTGTIRLSRGLFGKKPDKAYLENVLRSLSLWDKKDAPIGTLSGGMKRRVLIAKALAHEPRILFLDEPTAGVDVELRKDLWTLVRSMRDDGVTIILTTHYIAEAEEIADRVAVINNGEIMLVEEKAELMRKLGRKKLVLDLHKPVKELPEALGEFALDIANDGHQIVFDYDTQAERTGITRLLAALNQVGIGFRDLSTSQSSLEDIFVDLVHRDDPGEPS